MTTLTIMRILPREVDPMVYSMSLEDPGGASFAGIGGLGEQVRELREVIELPLLNPELFTVSLDLSSFQVFTPVCPLNVGESGMRAMAARHAVAQSGVC